MCPTPELRAFCDVLAWTGCRLSEALALTPADLDAGAGSVTMRGRGSVREVPDTLLAQLAALPAPQGAFWPWGRTTAWRYVKGVMAAAIGGLHASPKGLRHGFGNAGSGTRTSPPPRSMPT